MKKEFIEGIKDGIPICLGYFSVSIAFGLAVAMSGVPVWAAVIISLSNLTSAGQFAGAQLMIAGGTMIELALTTAVINIRYFLMSMSVSQKVSKDMKFWQRFPVSFGITDEIFAVSMGRKSDLTASYMAGLIILPVIGWSGGTFVGATVTSLMPQVLADALGIALYGMFIAIIVPAAKEAKNVLFAVILAIVLSVVFTYAPVISWLSSGWSIIIITIVVSAVAALLFPVEFSEEEGE